MRLQTVSEFLANINVALIRKALKYYSKNHPRERDALNKELKNWEESLKNESS